MKLRADLYRREAGELLRNISMYPGLSETQLSRFFPGKEESVHTLLSHMIHTGRAILSAEGRFFSSSEQLDRYDPLIAHAVWVILKGGVGRIRVYGVEGFDYADIAIETTGKVNCNMLRMVPLSVAQASALQDFSQTVIPPEQLNTGPDPKIWYEKSGRNTLEQVVNDLNSRGHHSLTIHDDGSIHISGEDSQDGSIPTASLADFPPSKKWSELVNLFAEDGLNATLNQDTIELNW